MLGLNLGNLDRSAKRCLELLLKPRCMHIIEPWTLRASDTDKKLIMKICVALHRDYSKLAVPLIKSDSALQLPANQITESFDRYQVRRPSTAPFPTVGPADKYPIRILQGSSNSKASDLYHLKFMPIESEPFTSLVTPQVVSQLNRWQLSVLNADIERPEVLRVFRSLFASYQQFQDLTNRPRTSSASDRLFANSVGPKEVVHITSSQIQDRLRSRPVPLGPVTTSFLPKKTIYRKPFDSHGGPLPFSLNAGNRFSTTYARDFIERPAEPWNRSKTTA
jgi:hypothetical protein